MTMGTSTAQAYGEPQYWDDRYANESAPFDWYQKYPSLAPLTRLYVPHNHQRILVVGCGNSFSEDMVNDGYEDVVNVDISSVVIKAMQNKYQNRSQLKYIEMDVKDMSAFEAGSFDAVIGKGTLDSILVSVVYSVFRDSSRDLDSADLADSKPLRLRFIRSASEERDLTISDGLVVEELTDLAEQAIAIASGERSLTPSGDSGGETFDEKDRGFTFSSSDSQGEHLTSSDDPLSSSEDPP
ncbi:hypothetical protein SLE2022_093380 [Rubroshorea leprosula]